MLRGEGGNILRLLGGSGRSRDLIFLDVLCEALLTLCVGSLTLAGYFFYRFIGV